MRVCLVSALSKLGASLPEDGFGDFDDAPLGVLTLASILERDGVPVEFLDLDWEYARHRRGGGGEVEFADAVATRLARSESGMFGFSTLCQSWPLTLAIVRRLKKRRPDACVVLGGPQASTVDVPAIRQFPDVDFIVRGEADDTLPRLVEAVAGRRRNLELLPGLTYRSYSAVCRTPDPPPVVDLDALPLPAYHLYEGVSRVRRMVLEAGRGCPFACSFCSTNDFFRRRFRLKTPAVLLGQMRRMEALYGADTFSLVHDMFTVDRRRVVEFCEAFIAAGSRYRWSCSARTDCVDEPLLELMARARCTGLFFGIETGSAALQKSIAKNLVLPRALEVVRQAAGHGIDTTVSLITGFPDETAADFRDTVSFMLSAAPPDSVQVQLHLLSPLAGTPLEVAHRGRLLLDRTKSDISKQMQLPQEAAGWIEAYPEIFSSFYHIPAPHLDRQYLAEAREFLLTGLRHARWLLLALHQIRGHILDVFDTWRTSPFAREGALKGLLRFSESHYGRHPAIAALLHFYALVGAAANEPVAAMPMVAGGHTVPVLAEGTQLFALPFSLSTLLATIREGRVYEFAGGPPETVAVTPRAVVALHPLQAGLLSQCDGRRSVEAVVRSADRSLWACLPGIKPAHAGYVVLDDLAKAGIVSWRAGGAEQTRAAAAGARSPQSGG